jgi:poly-gamma-glutamate capsule biosynthesis protein CapA/YwtB (metallophosphatase superfamily)
MATATIFLCGDVMTGRGVDQILPHPGAPRLQESHVRDARDYVTLAETASGPVDTPVDFAYIWGEALPELERADARIVNLETSVTTSESPWPDKGIHYRMNPSNVPCLTVARIDACSLANNHVLDYGRAGLVETLDVLGRAGIATAGAGEDSRAAARSAVLPLAGGRLTLLAYGTEDSGVPPAWAAAEGTPGVGFLADFSAATTEAVAARVRAAKQEGGVVVVSIHWGSNWGYAVPPDHVRFAHRLVDSGADVVHGHSSHHPRPIECHRGRLILYGCGDLINDYEGIRGYEEFRDDLVLAYFATVELSSGALVALRMTPMQLHGMRLRRADQRDAAWLRQTLERVSGGFELRLGLAEGGDLLLL